MRIVILVMLISIGVVDDISNYEKKDITAINIVKSKKHQKEVKEKKRNLEFEEIAESRNKIKCRRERTRKER